MIQGLGLLLSALLIAPLAGAAELQCRGIVREVKDQDYVKEEKIQLEKTYHQGPLLRFEGELLGQAFTANVDQRDEEVLISITEAPTYQNGIITRAKLSAGRVSLSQTKLFPVQEGETAPKGFFVYRLECSTN